MSIHYNNGELINEVITEQKLETLYQELAVKVLAKNKITQRKLTICPCIKGSNDAKYMFIGRSINGWCPIPDNVT